MENFKLIFGLVVAFIIGTMIFRGFSQTKLAVVENCKVMDLQQQQIISGSDGNMSTEIRYLVITDKETFVCENSFINGKFNNSDIFWRLKKDSTYTFKVAGIGKGMMTDYRNILEFEKNE